MSAVLLMAHGAAESLDDIPAYLQDILGKRPLSPELVSMVRERYRSMGGRSPLLDISRAQASALEKTLGLRVYLGMRHSRPTILEAVQAIQKDGHERLISMALTPFYSKMSVGAYTSKLEEAMRTANARLAVTPIRSWSDQPALIQAWAQKLREALIRISASRPTTGKNRHSVLEASSKNREVTKTLLEHEGSDVLFTAHSLPERILKDGDPYPEELQKTSAAVAKAVGLESWKFAYQSRGATNEPWLGPDAADMIRQSAAEEIVIVPIGFVSDHMETLYDDDILYRDLAASLGKRFERAASLNADPLLIEAMATAIRAASARGQGIS